MVVTRTIARGTTVAARGVPNPDSRYSYAVVLTFEGPLASLARRSAESAARDVLSARRAVSWTALDGGDFRLQFTRGDPEFSARVTRELLSALESSFEQIRRQYDDGDFDRAFDDVSNE